MRSQPFGSCWRGRGSFSPGVAAGMALLAVAYPNAFLMPVQALLQSVQISSDFIEWDWLEPLSGCNSSPAAPMVVCPGLLGSQIPVLLLLAGTLGLAVALFLSARTLVAGLPNARARTAAGLSAGLRPSCSGPAPVGSAIDASLQWCRQLLFVVPALSVLVVVGIWWLAVVIDRSPGGASKPVAVAGSSLLRGCPDHSDGRSGQAVPLQLRLLQRVRCAQALRRAMGNGLLAIELPRTCPSCWAHWNALVSRSLRPGSGAAQGPVHRCPKACQWPTIDPFLAARGQVSRIAFDDQSDFWFIQNNFLGPLIPSNCEVADSVHRSLHGQQVTMSYLALCPLPQSELDERAGSASGAS